MSTTTITSTSTSEATSTAPQVVGTLSTSRVKLADRLDALGRHSVRGSLVVILLWIGAMKFTAYEAEGISGLVANSPVLSWAYQLLSTRQFSTLLGIAELTIAGLIVLRPVSPKASALGSALAAGMFITTLSFLFTTPGVVEASIGFPALSVLPGQFLIKDVALLGISIWTCGEALRASRLSKTV